MPKTNLPSKATKGSSAHHTTGAVSSLHKLYADRWKEFPGSHLKAMDPEFIWGVISEVEKATPVGSEDGIDHFRFMVKSTRESDFYNDLPVDSRRSLDRWMDEMLELIIRVQPLMANFANNCEQISTLEKAS